MSTACHFPSKMSCDSLVLLGPCVTWPMYIGSRCVQICSAALTLWKSLKVPAWHHMVKNSLRILKDILLCYMEIAKATRRLPTPWNWAGVKLVWMAVTPGRSLFWIRYTRKPPNSLLKTCQQSTWITGTMCYGLMRWRLICLVLMASSMCGSDQERSTKISVSCLQSSMVVGMSWSKAAWVMLVLESYISFREIWTPTCTVKYCSRAWSPPSRNWVAGQCSSIPMTPNTSPRRPLLYWRSWGLKVMDWPSMSPDLNPIEHLWGIIKRKVEVHKISNICQLRDVVMEEWKSIPVATCEALVNSMPRRVKAVLDNDGGHTKYWQLTRCMLIFLTFPKGCTHFCWQGFRFNGYILSYFEGKIN